jgi:peptidoglycan/LPS O-acetylase OafA/YrhL
MFFYVGCLAAVVYRAAALRQPVRTAVTWGAVLAIAGLLVLQHVIEIKAKTFLVVFAPALIFLSVTYVPESRLANRLLVPAGNMTYASYLLHVPIQIAVVTYCNHAGIGVPFYDHAFFVLFLLVTLGLSYLTFEYFEMPAQQLMRRTFMGKRPSSAV